MAAKLVSLTIATTIPLIIGLFSFIMPKMEEQWYANKYESTKQIVEAVYNTFSYFEGEYKEGRLTLEEAQRLAKEVINSERYAGNNYFWINDLEHRIVAHPLRPERVGKDVSNLKDANGKLLYVEFVRIAKESGEGFIPYEQNKPGVEEPLPKVSFIKLFEPWGWVIGSGVYLNDVAESVAGFNNDIYLVIGIVFLIQILFIALLFWVIVPPVKKLNVAALSVSEGNYNINLEYEADDEIGFLSKTFNAMAANVKKAFAQVEEKTIAAEKASEEAKNAKAIAEKQSEYLSRHTGIILDEMEKFSRGDLTVTVKAENEGDNVALLFEGFNNSVTNINTLMHKVIDASESVSSASDEISASTEQMATGAAEQSSQTSEVARSVEQMVSTVHDTAKNSSGAAESANKSKSLAELGVQKVKISKTGMLKISESTEKTGAIVSSLAKKTDQIGEIALVIDEIADQTNLLALNAAIEAARAGEQGRGFAVVADEVRKLAERTTKATKEIAETIKSIQKEANDADRAMSEASGTVAEGSKITVELESVLNDILIGSEQLTRQIEQLAVAGEEQSSTAEEISKNIESINLVTEENSRSIEQIAKAAEDLNWLTNNLNSLVNEFSLRKLERIDESKMLN